MRTRVLFHLDPHDASEDMLCNRIEKYGELARSLRAAGFICSLYAAPVVAQLVVGTNLFDEVLASNLRTRAFGAPGTYHSLAQANQLGLDIEEEAASEYRGFQDRFDLIITNTPSSLLSKGCPNLPVLHYELGMFSRAPFPTMHQLDPQGYGHRSLLSSFPAQMEQCDPQEWKMFEGLRELAMNAAGLTSADIGREDVVYMPLQSEGNWTIRLETPLRRIDLIRHAASRFPNSQLVISEKLRNPLTPHERQELRSMPSVQVLDCTNPLSEGSFQVARSKTVFTTSPSMALQTLMWGNRLVVPEGSSMQLWGYPALGTQTALAAYLARFNLWSFDHAAHQIPRLIAEWSKNRFSSNFGAVRPSLRFDQDPNEASAYIQQPSTLISDQYRSLQTQLHENPEYGRASESFAPLVKQLIESLPIDSISDYGAGKKRLWAALGAPVGITYRPYDPVFPHYGPAMAADLTCCIDVLEHIEPDCLESVLVDLKRITTKFGFFTIHLGPAKKVLADGRNAHLIQKPAQWWKERLEAHFEITAMETHQIHGAGLWTLVRPKALQPQPVAEATTC